MIEKLLLGFLWKTIDDFSLEKIDELVKNKGKSII